MRCIAYANVKEKIQPIILEIFQASCLICEFGICDCTFFSWKSWLPERLQSPLALMQNGRSSIALSAHQKSIWTPEFPRCPSAPEGEVLWGTLFCNKYMGCASGTYEEHIGSVQ